MHANVTMRINWQSARATVLLIAKAMNQLNQLNAYELFPEAYRQRFRMWRKTEKQTNLEFAWDLTAHFTRRCSSLNKNSFQHLCNVIVLEQFKNSTPDNTATHIAENKVETAMEAAALADDYILTHRRSFGDTHAQMTTCGNVYPMPHFRAEGREQES